MNTYTLRNFRVFNNEGATFNIAPLTILTGCNSSGKSSVTKSMMLLRPFFKAICEDIKSGKFNYFSDYTLDFARGQHRLGSMNRAVNWSANKKEFSIGYSFYSWLIGSEAYIELTFFPDASVKEEDRMLRARLRNINIFVNGESIYSYHNGNDKPIHEGYFYLKESSTCTAGINKDMLIRAINSADLRALACAIRDDVKSAGMDDYYRTEVGVFVPFTNYKWSQKDYDSIGKFLGSDALDTLCHSGDTLKRLCGETYTKYMKHFSHTDKIKRNDSDELDFEQSKNEYDFSEQTIYPLGKLQHEMDSVAKGDFVDWVKEKFINPLTDDWYNTETYKNLVLGFANEFVNSEYNKFSDFYKAYEDAYLNHHSCSWGTHGGTASWEFRAIESGTACIDVPMNNVFDDNNEHRKLWADLKNHSEKFEYMFATIQGAAGYENFSGVIGAPQLEFPLERAIMNVVDMLCAEAICNGEMLSESSYIEINRANQQRCYTFDSQGTAFNQLLDDYAHAPESISKTNDYGVEFPNIYNKGDFARRWLKKLAGIDDFVLELAPEGIGYYVYLVKNVEGELQKILLADMGFGMTPLLSILLHLELVITRQLSKEYATPAIVCIEEPESNLHPKFQSILAEIFADVVTMKCESGEAWWKPNIRILLETHSEYLVRKLQVMVAKKTLEPSQVAIHYLYDADESAREGENQVVQINILENGMLDKKFGPGFFDEAGSSQLEIIKLARGIK